MALQTVVWQTFMLNISYTFSSVLLTVAFCKQTGLQSFADREKFALCYAV